MSSDPVESVLQRLAGHRDLLNAMNEQCQSLLVRVASGDGSVTVEVDGAGAMTGLWLGQSAYRNGADALSALILRTAAAAYQQAVDRQRYLLDELGKRVSSLEQRYPAGKPDTKRDES